MWAAQMAVSQNIGVPWMMCQQFDAPDSVVSELKIGYYYICQDNQNLIFSTILILNTSVFINMVYSSPPMSYHTILLINFPLTSLVLTPHLIISASSRLLSNFYLLKYLIHFDFFCTYVSWLILKNFQFLQFFLSSTWFSITIPC